MAMTSYQNVMGSTLISPDDELSGWVTRQRKKNSRDLGAKMMTPAQIAEAQRLAREWMAKHQR